jgi:hypothetical protein
VTYADFAASFIASSSTTLPVVPGQRFGDVRLGEPGADAGSICGKIRKMSKTAQRWKTGCDRLASERGWPLQRRSPKMTPAQTQPPKARAGVILLTGNDVRGGAGRPH